MTTIIDPLGNPVIVYNRDGTALIEMDAPSSSTTDIPRVSGHTIAVVTVVGTGNAEVRLPADAEVGDVVEIYNTSDPWSPIIRAPTGETISTTNPDPTVSEQRGKLVRKLTGGRWFLLGL